MSYIITTDNFLEAHSAIRDILFMYRDLILSYEGFGHNIEVGTFDPFTFVDAELREKPGHTLAMDMNLIHQGSAVALLCQLSDAWDDYGNLPYGWDWIEQLYATLEEGRLDHLPLAKAALMAGLESEEELRLLLPNVYNQFVVGYFHRLLHQRG
jgi:hypothetical protein